MSFLSHQIFILMFIRSTISTVDVTFSHSSAASCTAYAIILGVANWLTLKSVTINRTGIMLDLLLQKRV